MCGDGRAWTSSPEGSRTVRFGALGGGLAMPVGLVPSTAAGLVEGGRYGVGGGGPAGPGGLRHLGRTPDKVP